MLVFPILRLSVCRLLFLVMLCDRLMLLRCTIKFMRLLHVLVRVVSLMTLKARRPLTTKFVFVGKCR